MAVDFRTGSGRLAVYTTLGSAGSLIREFDNSHYFKIHNELLMAVNIHDNALIYNVNNIYNITINGVSTNVSTLASVLNSLIITLNNALPTDASTESTQIEILDSINSIGTVTNNNQSTSILNEYTQLDLLKLIYEELQAQTKILKKIYQ